MTTDGARMDGTRDPALDALASSGAVDGALTARLTDADGPLVSVRPAPEDGPGEWVAHLESLLDIGQAARVAVVAEDAVLAAALASRLAVSVADGGRRVVLVDGSVHRPVIAKALEGDGDEGLVDSVVFGVSTAVTARRTLAAGVSLMTSGSVPVSSSDVFAADGFEATLGGFAQDVAVFVALPAEFLGAALHAFSHVVAAGRSVEEIRSIASAVRERRGAGPSVTIGVLALRPRPEAPAALVEARQAAPVRPSAEQVPEHVPERSPGETGTQVPRPAPGAHPEGPAPEGAPAPPPQTWTAAGRSRRSPARTARLPQPVPPTRPPARGGARAAAWCAVALIAIAGVTLWRTGAIERLSGPRQTGGSPARPEVASQARPSAGEPRRQDGERGEPPLEVREPAVPPAEGAGTPGDARTDSPAATGEAGGAAAAAAAQGALAGPGGRYVVFVSSHRTEEAALADAQALAGRGVAAEAVRAEVGGTGTWFRVRVSGGYPTLAAARDALESLKALEYGGAWIERAPAEG